ncbi:hypothetical protein SDC9_76863 [bioreactor metagenome]|uniref:Uncharacterized protein n=1 Tax=bioreactor metagenome TaxID=1076179 RepID=A0A644YNZ1_9ZZZZ
MIDLAENGIADILNGLFRCHTEYVTLQIRDQHLQQDGAQIGHRKKYADVGRDIAHSKIIIHVNLDDARSHHIH